MTGNGDFDIMKKALTLAVLSSMCLVSVAQDKSLGAVNYNYFSEVKDNPAWMKDVITAEGDDFGTLKDRQGVLAPKQSAVALEIATSNLTEVAQAYSNGFERGIANLVDATNNIPKSGFTFGLVVPLVPSASRTAIEGFVVDTEYDSENNTDILTIHFTQSLAIEPVIEVPYVSDSGMTTNRVKGSFRTTDYAGSHWTNKTTRVLGPDGIEYDNCHKCYVRRPTTLQGMTAWFKTNVRWGSETTGIDYGNIVHLAFGEPLFNGTLTNTVDNTYVVIKDGAIMAPGFVPITETTESGTTTE